MGLFLSPARTAGDETHVFATKLRGIRTYKARTHPHITKENATQCYCDIRGCDLQWG